MEQDTSFDEFMEAFGGDTGNQTEQSQETDTQMQQGEDETVNAAETESDAEDVKDNEQAAEEGSDDKAESSKDKPDTDSFVLKVNKEEKTYSREEVISLAQKGADYDRVKEQLTQTRATETDLRRQLDDQKEIMDSLAEIAKETQQNLPQLITQLRHNVWKKQGLSDDAIAERELRLKAEKENAQLKSKPAEKEQPEETSQQRAKKDLEDFRKEYPTVELTDELLDKLSADIQGGGSLMSAYRKYEAAEKDAKIAQLEKALAAEKKNKENRASSPGSQRDSGGRREKNEFDDFMEAFR